MTNKPAYQPEGYQSVIPYLHVNGAAKLITFMKEVFDAQRSQSIRGLMAQWATRRSESAIQ